MASTRIVVVGAGPAGTHAALKARERDPDAWITVIDEEGVPFYVREHLVKLVVGKASEDELFELGRDVFESRGISFRAARVAAVSTREHLVVLEGGEEVPYDRLLVATGAKPLLPNWPGADLEGVSTLYSLSDAREVARLLPECERVVVVGGGTIALKLAPALVGLGLRVTMLEKAGWPVGTVLDEVAGRLFREVLEGGGVEVRTSVEVVGFEGADGRVKGVRLAGGEVVPADLVVVSIGVRASTEPLRDSAHCDVHLERGVVVDASLATNVPDVFAAGDVAQVADPVHGKPTLHPSWSNAKQQGTAAGISLTGGSPAYAGTTFVAKMRAFGFGLVVAGLLEPPEDGEVLRVELPDAGYRRVITRGDAVVGLLVAGRGLPLKKVKKFSRWLLLNPDKWDGRPEDLLDPSFGFKR
ncbi:MAG: FAD-dependent oxidoreductase [Promethearchaeota archaeon]